jgi:PAS domain S-box-containing protein
VAVNDPSLGGIERPPDDFPGETELLLTIFASSPNAISIADMEGNLRTVNPRALELFGHPDTSDVIGQSVFAWIMPEEHARAREELARLATDGTLAPTLFHLRRRDGSAFTGEVRASIVRLSPHRQPYFLVSVEDRTAQLEYEHALQSILKGTSSDVGGQFFQAFVRELSHALGMRIACIGRTIGGDTPRVHTIALCIDGESHDPATLSLASCPCDGAAGDGVLFVSEGAADALPSVAFLKEWNAEAFVCMRLRDAGGHIKGLLAVAHDHSIHDTTLVRSIMAIFASRAATEIGRLEADELLWENERRMRSIIDQAPFAAHMYEVRDDGSLVFAGHNRSADQILKVDHHKLVGLTIEEAWPPLAATPIPDIYRRIARGAGPYNTDSIQFQSAGIDGAFEINAFQTGPNRMAVFFRDVTERRKAEQALLAAKEKAEAANHAKTVILRNLSHEFRTPITGILGMAEILLAEARDPRERNAVNDIVASAHRLHHSLDAILRLSQLVSGTVTPASVDVSLRDLLEQTLGRYRRAAEMKGLSLHTMHTEGPDRMLCDRQLLEDTLGYLVDNAVKYTASGGVTIRSAVAAMDGSHWCTIEVEDTGIGIAPENQETIFQEFRQLSEGYGREYEGSGLGLTLARRIAELMGGSVSVRSATGSGATFVLRLPAGQRTINPPGPVASDPLRTSPSHYRTGMPEVLIVEDNFINEKVMAEFLKHMCHTEHARDGQTAIRMARSKQYDAVLMDINLGPGLDGIETSKAIRQIQGYKEIPIVAVTGYTLPGDRDRLYAEGLTHYIPKPFGQKDIQDTVRKILPR